MIASKIQQHTQGWKPALITLLIIAFIPMLFENFYYKYSKLEKFVNIEKLDFQDYKKGEKTQLLLSYRNSKIDTIGDFYYKVFCEGKTHINWSYNTNGIILPKTEGLNIIKVGMPTLILPKGKCLIKSKVIFHIKGYKRETFLEDTFIVK